MAQFPQTISNLYLVTREGDAWLIRPSSLFASIMVAAFAGGCAFCLYPAGLFLGKSDDPIGAGFACIFLVAAMLLAALAVKAWRSRSTPLVIESAGRVSYKDRELCAAGTVRAVRLAPLRGGDAGDCELRLEQDDGNLVSLPSQYFAGFGTLDQARPFAEALATALRVPVNDTAT